MAPNVAESADRSGGGVRPRSVWTPGESLADARRIVVVGGGHRGRQIARAVAAIAPVYHVDARETAVETPAGYTASHVPDVESITGLAAVGFRPDDVALVATASDRRNLLVTQQLRTRFDVDRIVVVVNDPQYRSALELPGVSCLCVSSVLGAALVTELSETESDDSHPTR